MEKFWMGCFIVAFAICGVSVGHASNPVAATGSDLSVDLQTPRGSAIKLDIYNKGASRVLYLAQGQGCNPRLEMYGAIASEAKKNDFTLVRLYWAYCVAEPKGKVSADLALETEDFLTGVAYIENILGYSRAKIFVGGKSLGTYVSSEVFKADKSFPGLVMLTPICTDGETNPAIPRNAFAEYYPGLEKETRPVLITQGNQDDLCQASHFQEFLSGRPANFVPLVVAGDHGFGLQKPNGSYDTVRAERNLKVVSTWIFAWLE